MTNRRKGRGSGRSSIAPPYRLRRSVPPPDVAGFRNKSLEAIPEEQEGINDDDRFGERGSNEQESEQIDGSIQKSFEDFEPSSPSSSQPQAPSDDRPSDNAERWDEPGSRAVTETASSVPDDRPEGETNGTSRIEADTTATQSQAPRRAVDDSTAADFFNKSDEASAPERFHEQSTDTWESQYDSMSVSRGPKKASYIIYTTLAFVLIALGGFYFYGSTGERSNRSQRSRLRLEEVKSASGTTPTASQALEPLEPKPPEAVNTKSDKMRETTQTDVDPKRVETVPVSADVETGANHPPTAVNDESSQIGASQAQPKAAIDGECCDSIEAYQEALRLNPNDTDILGKLAYFYLNKGMNQEARRFAERTVNINPKSSTGWIVLGAAFDAMNDHEAALEAYKMCAEQAVGKYVMECRNLVRERK
jgi:Flp pilus assembly protein TadD